MLGKRPKLATLASASFAAISTKEPFSEKKQNPSSANEQVSTLYCTHQ